MAKTPISFRRDEDGAVIVEFTAVILLLLTSIFGIVEFSYAFYQWNAATKAAQIGARIASVSSPVAEDLALITGLASGAAPGSSYAGTYDVTCAGTSCRCDGTECPAPTMRLNTRAMNDIVYGRGHDSCVRVTDQSLIGMCQILPKITPDNVTVRYSYTGLGYVGREGGPVPTITISLTGLKFDFILLSAFLASSQIDMPSFATTVTGEDLRTSS